MRHQATMAMIWDELTAKDKEYLARKVGKPLAVIALMKVPSVWKYTYYDADWHVTHLMWKASEEVRLKRKD